MKDFKKIRAVSKRALVAKLDRVFSRYIRLKSSVNGMVQCYTCGSWHPMNEMTVGHFIKRQYLGTRFDERNVKPQCRKCNYFLQGNDLIFAEKLKQEYGENIVSILEFQKNESLSIGDLQMLLTYYSNLLNNEKREK